MQQGVCLCLVLCRVRVLATFGLMSLLVLLCLGVATPALSGWAVPLESAAKVRTFAGMCGLSSCFSCSAGADFFGEPGDVSSCSHGHPPQAQLPSPKICSLQPIFQIAPGQREQLGKDAAASAQKVCFAWALGALCCSFVSKQLQAYAPTQNKVQAFLSSEVHAEHACPACDNKDYSDGSVAQSVSTNADSYRVVCLFFARCPDGWDAADGRCLLREASSRAHPLLLPGERLLLLTVARQAESARSEGQLSPNDRDVAQPGLCGRRQARSGQQGN